MHNYQQHEKIRHDSLLATSAEQHQLIIEANVGTIRDRIRSINVLLNFQPDATMARYLIKWAIHTLNYSYNRVVDDIPMHKLHPY